MTTTTEAPTQQTSEGHTIRVTDERTTALCNSCSQRVVELSPDEFASWLDAPASAKPSHTCGICVAMTEVSR